MKYWKMILNAAKKTAEIIIYEQIGKDFWTGDGIVAQEFAKDLKDLGNVEQIDVRISSPGGFVQDGLAIYNLLKSHKANITTFNDGFALSIASVIFMAGDKRVMAANASFMIHDPMATLFVQGNAEDMEKESGLIIKALETMKTGLISAYRGSGLTDEVIENLMADETWFTADEAKESGFVHEVVGEIEIAAHYDLSQFKNAPLSVDKEGLKGEHSQSFTIKLDGATIAEALEKTHRKSVIQPITGHNNNNSKEVEAMKCTVCGNALVEGSCPHCVSVEAATKKARDILNKRTEDVMALAEKYGCVAQAAKFLQTEGTVSDFKDICLDEMGKATPIATSGVKVGEDNEAKKPFKNFGEQLLSVVHTARNPGEVADKRLLFLNAASGAQEGVDTDGGFLVQTDFSAELMKVTYETGVLINRCRKIPISGNANGIKINAVDETSRATGSRFGGLQTYWGAEADSATKSKPKFRQMELTLHKLLGLCYMTDELLADAAATESIIMQAFPEEFNFMVDDAIIRGSGTGKPKGILNGGALVTVAKETGQTANTIVVENIVNMYSRCHIRSRPRAVWFINQDIEPQLFTMGITVGTGGAPIYMPPGGISGSPYATLLGLPVVAIEHADTLGTKGDIMLLSLSEYLLIDKGGIDAQSSMHVKFITDEMTFRFTYRIDGQPIWNSAITPFKGTATKSPFVTLATRA